MAYKIKYPPLAVQDLTDIAQYLSVFYPKTAPRVPREIREKIEKLSTTTNICREYEHAPGNTKKRREPIRSRLSGELYTK